MDNKKDERMTFPATGASRDAGQASAAPNPAIAVGEQLAAARVSKGRSIDEMASRLKVAPAKVAAIEAGDLSALHDAAFAVGLVRSYAKVLGVEPDPLTDALRGVQRPAPELALPASTTKPSSMRRANVPLSWSTRRSDRRSWVWGGSAAVIVLALLVVWRVGNEPNGWLQRFKGDAASDAAAAGVQVASGSVVSALPPVGASTMTDSGNAAASDSAASIGAVVSASTLASAVSASEAASSAAASATLAAVSSASDSAGAPAAPVPAASDNAVTPAAPASTAAVSPASAAAASQALSHLTIEVSQDTWVSVKGADGKNAFSGIVHAGQQQVIDAVRPVQLIVGNIGGVLSLSQDGKPIDLTPYAGRGRNVARFALK